jgi:hypothetical protein
MRLIRVQLIPTKHGWVPVVNDTGLSHVQTMKTLARGAPDDLCALELGKRGGFPDRAPLWGPSAQQPFQKKARRPAAGLAGQRVEVNIAVAPESPAGIEDPTRRACGVA